MIRPSLFAFMNSTTSAVEPKLKFEVWTIGVETAWCALGWRARPWIANVAGPHV
jgi:hypothetical protein